MSSERSSKIFKDLNQKLVVEAIHRYISRNFLSETIEACGVGERKRKKLGSVLMIYFILYQCLFRESNREEVLKKMAEGYQCRGWDIPAKAFASHSGISRALKRIGPEVIKRTYEACVVDTKPSEDSWYKGMRMKAYDGSRFNLEDSEENRNRYGKPPSGSKAESAWPQLHVLMEIDVGTHLPGKIVYGEARRSASKLITPLLDHVKNNELVLLDRELSALKHLEKIQTKGGHFLARSKMDRGIQVIRTLADGSYLGRIQSSKGRAKLVVRVIEYRITNTKRGAPDEIHRLLTSLWDEKQHPAKELIELYHQRWEIELSFDELKTHLFKRTRRESFFRSRRKDGVIQELYGLLVIYFIIRSMMQEAGERYGLAPRQLSFVDCVQILRRGIVRMQIIRTERLPIIYDALLDEMAGRFLPERRDRVNPRVVKKHHTKFTHKRKEHYRLEKLTTKFLEDIEVLVCS